MPVSLRVAVRKILFLLTGRPLLSDSVRNFAYAWVWEHVKGLPAGSRLCDIGSRSSAFPAFCAWRNFAVSAVEADVRFVPVLHEIARRWTVDYEVVGKDFLDAGVGGNFTAITSLFGLQHAGARDTDAYAKAARMLASPGIFLSVCEYCHSGELWRRGRDDGDLRVYGPAQVRDRLEQPLRQSGCGIVERRGAVRTARGLTWTAEWERAEFCFVVAEKPGAVSPGP